MSIRANKKFLSVGESYDKYGKKWTHYGVCSHAFINDGVWKQCVKCGISIIEEDGFRFFYNAVGYNYHTRRINK